jgi:hypothetical protein
VLRRDAEAARQLLTAGASMEPRLRWIAAEVAGLLQEEALSVWREMTGVPGMGPHAKFALFTMGAGPEPDDGEWLWLAVESAAVALAERGPDEAVTVLWPCTAGTATTCTPFGSAARRTATRRSRSRRPVTSTPYGCWPLVQVVAD